MSTRYERYRPAPYYQNMSIFWWVKRKPYMLFIVRELTSLFVAAYVIILMVKLNALKQGAEAWETLLASLSGPFFVSFHVVILIFVLFHSVTWFKLAPSAMVVKIGKKSVPGSVIIAANFLLWILLSAGIAWIFLQ